MTKKRSIILIAFTVLLSLLIMRLVNKVDDDVILESSNLDDQQTVGYVDADSSLIVRDANLNKKLAERFRMTVDFIEKGQSERAIAELNEIISQQPNAIEPYINLASIYAKSNDIDKAKETLTAAIDVNENTSVLFNALQKIYATQAALAYQNALDINEVRDGDLSVSLPTIDTLMVNKPSDDIKGLISDNQELQKKVDDSDAELKQLRQNLAQALKEKNELVVSESLKKESDNQGSDGDSRYFFELQQAQLSIEELKKQHLEQVNELKTQSDAQILALQRELDLQAALLAESSIRSSDESVLMSAELTDNSVTSAQNRDSIGTQIKPTEIVELVEQPISGGGISDEETQSNIAINLVKSWARSWSAQDVDGYVSYYENQFRPESGVSNQTWREQRQVRLTNKTFIDVDVKGFIVEEKEDHFSVTFSQHYKSDNVDNTIIKRLTFKKKGNDWSESKIVQEQIISS